MSQIEIINTMKYVTKYDTEWHYSDREMPSSTTDVDFMDINNNIYKGEIVVEMSGFYAYLEGEGWSSFSVMIKWRFNEKSRLHTF